MPIPSEDAYRRISQATRDVERMPRTKRKPGRRFRPMGGDDLVIYLGQPTQNVTPSTPIFTLTNLTRFPGAEITEAIETIDVKNTQNLEVESGEKVVYAVEVIVDGEIEYETWGPGEGSGFPGVRFELVADFTLDAQLAVGKILNDDGTVPEEDTLIAITDEHKSFCGYGPYTDSEDEEQPGFRGTAIKYTDDQDQTRYYITSIERLYPLIIVELNDGVEEQVGPFETDFLRGIGNTYRNPKRLSSGVMNTYNTEHLADGATDATKWVAGYDANTDQYELLFGAGSVSDIEVGIIFSTIPAAVVTQSSVTPGTGNIFIESTGQVETCENLSKTPFRGDSQEPIAVGVAKRANGNWLILNDKDNRSLPGFGTINPQWMVHRGNGSFELIRACDKNVVYSVEVDTSQQTDFLVYKSRTWDGCSEAVTPIVALEDCE